MCVFMRKRVRVCASALMKCRIMSKAAVKTSDVTFGCSFSSSDLFSPKTGLALSHSRVPQVITRYINFLCHVRGLIQ